MKLTIEDNSKNYTCSVVEIKDLFPIDGADKIVRTVVNGNNVVVPKTTQVGSKMLYFVSGTKLNEEYCKNNNLYDRPEENTDSNSKGFISYKQKRVKAIKLRGVISDGMLMPLTSLTFMGIDVDLKVGDEFTTINGTIICEKWLAPFTKTQERQLKSKQPKGLNRLVDKQFYLHNDTENLRKNIHKLNPEDVIGIHYKKHGTSVVIGNVLVKRQLSLIDRVAKFLGVKVKTEHYDVIYSSRKVVKNQYLNPTQNTGFYGEDIWGVVAKQYGYLIPKGWTLYGEILGYTPTGTAIQGKYDYGCKQGEHLFYVYKISVVNEDGYVTYLTDIQIQEWCNKVGLLYSDTLIYYGTVFQHLTNLRREGIEFTEDDWREKYISWLEKNYNEKDCYMCSNKVPEEGIVIRVEKLEEYEAYKLKSKRFILAESEEQEKEISNIEDNQ